MFISSLAAPGKMSSPAVCHFFRATDTTWNEKDAEDPGVGVGDSWRFYWLITSMSGAGPGAGP